MADKCVKYGGKCIGCGECDFERRNADVLSHQEIDKRIEALRSLRKNLSKGVRKPNND